MNQCHIEGIRVETFEGLSPYKDMWDYQKQVFETRVGEKKSGEESGEDCILVVEHSPVITLGKHGKSENLLFSEESLKNRGIDCFRIERGGDITYHGPGQLVVYPIIDLERYRLGVKAYVDMLEECVIRTIAEYGIKGERVEGASGVWIGKGTPGERKICAVGVKCSRFITMHGMALNVNTDLNAFTLINPCGFIDKGVTSISREVGNDVEFSKVAERLIFHLTQLLSQARV
ncbi:MAG: lipoyl(octanoyl) transferase LipB [Bacteroides sp.]|nr:lipoyl(octanoyl) transferase LipB [Bacteroides sp.]